jgi:glycine cleavage system pyridoxal-binding protein P
MKDFDRYLPHTQEDIRSMLDAIGVKNLEDLFDAISMEYRLSKPLNWYIQIFSNSALQTALSAKNIVLQSHFPERPNCF